jgi:ribonuclease BN (tRNA processing enzyme)
MESKIIFLGTGGDAVVVGKQLRKSGGFVIQTQELQFHVDPGPCSLAELRHNKLNVRETSIILLSHLHTNHSNDLRAVIQGMTLGGLDKRGVLVCNEASSEGFQGAVPVLDQYHRDCLERMIVMKPGQNLGIGTVEITATHTNHTVPGIGFKFSAETFTLGYTSDTSYTEALASNFKGTDILILNVVAPFGYSIDGHLNSDDAIKLLSKVKPKVAVITHFGLKMINQDPMYQAREIHKRTGVTVIAAEDGLTLSPEAYSIKKRQKKLSSF